MIATWPDAETNGLLIRAARTVLVPHKELERAARGADTTIRQDRILLAFKRGRSRARELAHYSAVERPAASALIKEMEKRGLVVREADARDSRSEILRLTPPAGVAQHSTFERELARVLGEVIPQVFCAPRDGNVRALRRRADLGQRRLDRSPRAPLLHINA